MNYWYIHTYIYESQTLYWMKKTRKIPFTWIYSGVIITVVALIRSDENVWYLKGGMVYIGI